MNQFFTVISKLNMDSGQDSAVGDVFVAQPKPELKNKLGTIIGLIELFAQPDEFVDKFFEIINDLETEYYLPPFDNEGGLEKRFEECLQRANRRINKIINDFIIEIELKNINSFIGLISKNRIYLSQIGKSNALLFHRRKRHDYVIVDIFSQTGEKITKINQEKMFSNIINGTISEKDNLFFCNDSVLEYVSQNELMEIMAETDPFSALKEIERVLKPENKNNNFYAIAIESTIKEIEDKKELPIISNSYQTSLAAVITPQTSINKLISTQEDTEKYLVPSMAPNWKKIIILLVSGFKKAIELFLKYFPKVLTGLLVIIKTAGHYCWKKIPPLTETVREIISKKKKDNRFIREPRIKRDESITKNPNEPAITTIQDEETDEIWIVGKRPDHLKFGPNQTLLQKMSDWLNSQLAKFMALSRLQQILLTAIIILVFFFSQSLVWQGQIQTSSEKTGVSELISQTEAALNNGEAQNIFNDEEGSKQSLTTAQKLMAQIPNSKKYSDIKDKLQKRIDELEKSLQKISYIDQPNIIADLANQNQEAASQSIAKLGNYIFAFDNQNQNIYKIDLVKKQTIARQLPENFSDVRKIAALDENNIIILNDQGGLYQYSFENNSSQSVLTSNETIADFSIYSGKIYTLKPDKNQIFKHFPVETGYNSGSAWIKDGTNVKEATALAIDSGIYVIYNQGEIKYLLNGRAEPIDFTRTDLEISSPRQIFSESTSNYLYILDQNNNRLVVLDKNNGNLKIQYTTKEFSDMKSMVIESQEKKIYLLADKKIYSIDIIN